MGIANCLASRGDLGEAEKQLRKLAQKHPTFLFAWFNLGKTVSDQGRHEEAMRYFRRAIALDPDFMDAYLGLGTAQQMQGLLDEAEHTYLDAVAREPRHISSHLNLASVQIDRGRFAAAEQTCRKVLASAPDCATAHCFLGVALGHQGRLQAALVHHREAAVLEPDNVRSLVALGIGLTEVGRSVAGIRALTRAIELAPDSWQAHVSLATAKRAVGEFDEGWRENIHRANRAQFMKLYPDIKLSAALPPVLDGLRVCIQRQEGLGDQLFFLRYARALKEAGARITYRSTPKIASLLERVPELDRVIRDNEPVPPSDHVVLAGDLSLVVLSMQCCELPPPAGNAGESTGALAGFAPQRAHGCVIPPLPPALVLTPLADELDRMRARLAALGPPPYVGLTWRGGLAPEEQAGNTWMLFKQVAPEALGAVTRNVSGTLIALQRNPLPGEIGRVSVQAGRPVHDLTALNDDLEAMLALLALIDDYIGVSNTNIHLRAGVGKDSRVLVPCPAEWRWMSQGNESPWFPGCAIYRQDVDGSWQQALENLARDLEGGERRID
jgi:tetratricopeptide (TPR) repeat protein